MSNGHPAAVALFGGMFDPPHLGHVAAVEAIDIRPLIVMVSGQPPHRAPAVAGMRERFEMARAAFEPMPGVTVNGWEIERAVAGEPTYTIDTVREIMEWMPGHRVALVIGADQARDFSSWHQATELANLVDVHILGRNVNMGIAGATVEGTWHDLDVDISSTQVRALLAEGKLQAARALVPPAVGDLLRDVYHGVRGYR
jgi:nicotinate-nucleotide adenylyltransferase